MESRQPNDMEVNMAKIVKDTVATVAFNAVSPEIGESDRRTVEYEAQLTPIPFIELGIVQEIGAKSDSRKTQLHLIGEWGQTDQQQIETVTELVDSITSARVSKTMQTRTYNTNQYDVPALTQADKNYLRIMCKVTRGFVTKIESQYIQYVNKHTMTAEKEQAIKDDLVPMLHFEGADKVVYHDYEFGKMD